MQVEELFERTEVTQSASRGPARSLTRCLVCGFAEARTDEAFDRELVFLAECPRCQHRWTSRAPLETVSPQALPLSLTTCRLQRVPARVSGGVAPAA